MTSDSKEWKNKTLEEKEADVSEWMFSEEFRDRVMTVSEKFEDWDDVKSLMIKIGDLSESIMDKEAGIMNLQAFKFALIKCLIHTFIAQQDFELSGR